MTRKKKTPAQLEREIAEALGRSHATKARGAMSRRERAARLRQAREAAASGDIALARALFGELGISYDPAITN